MKNFYLESIRDSQKGYIEDSWVFLRELAQNSRDSGALEIKIDPGGSGSPDEVVIFSDNGKGMTYREAEKYLFRLYSSSKFRERSSVGMYGVGFWTVMKFEPDEILIESYSEEEEKWGVVLSGDLSHKRVECHLSRFGTRITLIRKRRFPDHETFCRELEKGVRRYCRYLDRKSEKGKILPVIYRGKLISERLKFTEGISLKFSGRNFEGVVGLEELPRVTLLTGGIPAWEGSTLDELALINSENNEKYNYMKSGIAPVFHINGRNLRVNMSRREVIDDRQLREVLKRSRRALNELVQICSDHAYPKSRAGKLWFRLKKLYREISASYWKIILAVLILIIPVEIVILKKIMPPGGTVVRAPDAVSVEGYRLYSATVNKLGNGVIADIRYSPAENTWLKMFTAPAYDRARGFIWDGPGRYGPPSTGHGTGGGGFRVKINVRSGGDVFLPHPAGTMVDERSIRITGIDAVRLKRSASGEVTVHVPESDSILEYRCIVSDPEENTAFDNIYLAFPRDVLFPEKVEALIRGFFYQTIENKVRKAVSLTNILVKYDSSDGTAGYYAAQRDRKDWLGKVLEIGAGDCDVINGVLCLILRKSGVRSKLVIGLIGENGFTLPQLHSWIEYYDNGWKRADATPSSVVLGPGTPAGDSLLFGEKTPVIPDGKGSATLPLVFRFLFLLLLLSLFPFFLFYREKRAREKEKRSKLNPRNKIKARRDIIEIGKSYLLAPELWNFNFNIVEQKIITTLSGKNISIRKALRLLKQGRLYLGRSGNVLADELKHSDEVIIDSDNSIQHSLIRLFYGIIDLDAINGLSLDLKNENGTSVEVEFLDSVNRILGKLFWKSLICLSAGGLTGPAFKDIDLSLITYRKFFKRTGLPRKFTALNMNSPEISGLTGLFRVNPDLALYRFFRMFTGKSLFFFRDRDISDRKILRTILKNG